MDNKNFAHITKTHLLIYVIISLISFGFLFCAFIPCIIGTIFMSVGASGIASVVVAFLIERANNILKENEKEEKRNFHLNGLEYYFIFYVEKFIYASFRVMIEIYNEYDQNAFYKVDLKTFKSNMKKKFEEYDRKQHSMCIEQDDIIKCEDTKKFMDIPKSFLKYMDKTLDSLLAQDYYNLSQCYCNEEIKILTGLSALIKDPQEGYLEYEYSMFEYLTENLPTILNLKNFNNYIFYFHNKNSGFYDEKGNEANTTNSIKQENLNLNLKNAINIFGENK